MGKEGRPESLRILGTHQRCKIHQRFFFFLFKSRGTHNNTLHVFQVTVLTVPVKGAKSLRLPERKGLVKDGSLRRSNAVRSNTLFKPEKSDACWRVRKRLNL
jgi:hypothetical protein